jgi:type II secretion system protein C
VTALPLVLLLTLSSAPPDLAVSGVVVGRGGKRSSAVLTSGGATRVVQVGASAFGGRLLSVSPDEVVLDFDGERVRLRLPAAAPPPPGPEGPKEGPVLPRPEEPSPAPLEMDRLLVQRRLGEEIPRILAETALAPVVEDGRVVGMQITRLAEGTLLGEAGLRAGDVITRINGTDIDGMATLIGLWPRLQGATELQAVVLRAGRPVSLRLTLR